MRPSHPPDPPAPITEPTEFGEYVLLERLAVGGMAEIFLARSRPRAGEARRVVVKRMLPHIAAEPGSDRMFAEEATLGTRIEHANVVRVLEFGAVEGAPFLALELVPGLDLARLNRWLHGQARSLDTSLAVFLAAELLAGLHAVHEACDVDGGALGIVHGDVSPSNVLISTHGDVKLADFGIAEARLRKSFPQAAARRTKGKLAYLSPEQVRGEPTDRRSDVFAAAVLIAELLIGAPLFARQSELSTLLAVRDAKVEPLSERAHELPDGLVDALLKGLRRDPDERYPDAASLRLALVGFLKGPPAGLRDALGALAAEASGAEDQPEDDEDDRLTMEPPLDEYFVEREGGGDPIGPLTFAQLVEAVTMGRVDRADRMRVGSAPPRLVREIAELAGYFPAAPEAEPGAGAAHDVASGAFLDALAKSIAARASGVWVCEREGAKKEVYLVDGAPEFVSSNQPGEMLGEFLVTQGVLQRAELDMALAVLPRFDGRLGDTLAALGLIEPVELFQHIGAQVREKLLDLFGWGEGTARFQDGVDPPQRYFPLGIDGWRVLSEGIDRRLAAGLEQDRFVAHMLDELGRTRAPPPDGLPRDVLAVLEHTRRPRPLQVVVEQLEGRQGRDQHRPYRAIRLALALDLVRWIEPDAE